MNPLEKIPFRRYSRRGGALVEFAIVTFLLYFIIAAIFTFGRALFVVQTLQQTADTFAHELARTPLSPDATLSTALQDPDVQLTLFNENALEIDISPWLAHDGGLSLNQYLQQQNVPLINRMLAPVMIIDERASGTFLWYPGAVKDNSPSGGGHYYVNVLNGDGTSAPIHVPVIEPVTNPDTFALGTVPAPGSPATASGLAGVRINYPFQSTSLSASANKSLIVTNETEDIAPLRGGLYGGPNQLGQQLVATKNVRPYQRLLSAQAVYRREVFGP